MGAGIYWHDAGGFKNIKIGSSATIFDKTLKFVDDCYEVPGKVTGRN